jgi:ATP-dependent Clp protease ATP-binding subunit ClpA
MTTGSVAADAYHPWTTYMWASEEARRRGNRRVGTDHLVLALLEEPSVEAVLSVRLQDARDALDALDREALDALGMGPGIDASPLPMHAEPKRLTVRAVIKDRLRMTPAAKRVLQEAAKPMRRGMHITPQQVLVRILDLDPPDPAAVLVAALGVNTPEVRRRLASGASGT